MYNIIVLDITLFNQLLYAPIQYYYYILLFYLHNCITPNYNSSVESLIKYNPEVVHTNEEIS